MQSVIRARTTMGGKDNEKMPGMTDQHLKHKVREPYNYLGWKDLWRTSVSPPGDKGGTGRQEVPPELKADTAEVAQGICNAKYTFCCRDTSSGGRNTASTQWKE